MSQIANIKRPITGVFPFLRFALDREVDKNFILKGTGLEENDFFDPKNTIFLPQELTMVRNLIACFPEPETAWELGRYYYAKAHDLLGNMMECAPTVGDIVSCWCDYFPLLHSHCRVVPKIIGRRLRLYFPDKYSLPEDLVSFLKERDVTAGTSIYEKRLPGVLLKLDPTISFAHAPRTSIKKYTENFFHKPNFNQSSCFVEMDQSNLSFALPNTSPHKFELFRQQCQAELSLRNESSFFISDRVKLFLHADKQNTSFLGIAKKMNMSERSLRYQLSKEGTSFRTIRNQHIFQQSLILLRDPSLNIEEIAYTLGYSEISAFSRAFEKWVGSSPSKYRKKVIENHPS